jgi:hypothetical protein
VRPLFVGDGVHARRVRDRVAGWAGAAGLVGLAVVLYLTADDPRIDHSSVLGATFDTRWMIAGARLLAVASAGYLLASIAVRVHRRQWIRSAGSVVADTPTQEVVDDQRDLRERLEAAQQVITDLEEQLAEYRSMLQALSVTVGDPGAATDRDLSEEAEGDDGTDSTRDRPAAP